MVNIIDTNFYHVWVVLYHQSTRLNNRLMYIEVFMIEDLIELFRFYESLTKPIIDELKEYI